VVDIKRLQGEIEGIARDLPEIGMAPLKRAQPGVLQLLVAPEGRQLVDAIPQHVPAPSCRGCKVEYRAIGVKDAGLYRVQGTLRGHRLASSHGVPTGEFGGEFRPGVSSRICDRHACRANSSIGRDGSHGSSAKGVLAVTAFF